MSPLAGQMFFRASLFGAFGESKRWLGTNADGTQRALQPLDFYKAGAMTGAGGIVWVKEQVGIIRGQWMCSLSLTWHMQLALQLLGLSKVGAVVWNRRGRCGTGEEAEGRSWGGAGGAGCPLNNTACEASMSPVVLQHPVLLMAGAMAGGKGQSRRM